jgi:guanylate kinase
VTQSNFFIVTGAEGAGKTKVVSELEKILPFYWVNYVSNRDLAEKGTQNVGWDEYQRLAEADSFILSFRKRDSMMGVTYDEIKKAKASGKPIIWEVELKWLETVKNEFPEAKAILINGLNAEDLYEHFESKGHAVPAAMAIQAARSNRLNKWWHEWVDFIAENKKDASDKAAAQIKNIIEGKVAYAPA